MSVKAYSLFSGSSGNSFFIGTESAKILIDAGGSAKKIECALENIGESLDSISAVFITHEHSDHVASLDGIIKKRDIRIHMTEGTARAMVRDASSPICRYAYLHKDVFSVCIGDIFVTSFPVPHDAAQPVGYIVCADGIKIGYATDTGCVTTETVNNLSECDCAVIESNHDAEMLIRGPYPYRLKMRILDENGHLSNSDAAELAETICRCKTRSVMLAHLSKTNNTEKKALEAVRKAVGEDVYVCAAHPSEPTELKIPDRD